MIARPFWQRRIESSWREAPIVWLCGVRRSGKTTLAESLGPERLLYLDCDLPSVEEMVRDPQLFYRGCSRPIVVFDEIHQLRDPARVLKIGADLFPKLRILATGSSTLAASKKFRDTLTGRKRLVYLPPVLWEELPAFGVTLPHRLFHGGLPPALHRDCRNRPGGSLPLDHTAQVAPRRATLHHIMAFDHYDCRTHFGSRTLRAMGLVQSMKRIGESKNAIRQPK